jgi:response regulator RpfG family c-di-GMP phosphodiesterase
VLLTAYADTQAAIAAINQIGLDHYLMKPWNRGLRSNGTENALKRERVAMRMVMLVGG